MRLLPMASVSRFEEILSGFLNLLSRKDDIMIIAKGR